MEEVKQNPTLDLETRPFMPLIMKIILGIYIIQAIIFVVDVLFKLPRSGFFTYLNYFTYGISQIFSFVRLFGESGLFLKIGGLILMFVFIFFTIFGVVKRHIYGRALVFVLSFVASFTLGGSFLWGFSSEEGSLLSAFVLIFFLIHLFIIIYFAFFKEVKEYFKKEEVKSFINNNSV